ncbi:MAG: hypothetical protein K0Q55_2883 [Verrucomicrobia bacterium]|jgi:hypothetical protein|nr:hypothetical protein [Verrucomicrobiota bacterium]
MSNTLHKAVMWSAWIIAVLLSILMTTVLSKGVAKLNSFAVPFDLFPIGIAVIPTVICFGCRFWFSRMKSPWLALFPYGLGLFFALQAGLYGIFLVPEYFIVYRILGVVLYLGLFPLFMKQKAGNPLPPPIPS